MTGPLADVDLVILLTFTSGAMFVVWSIVVISGFLPLGTGSAADAGFWGKAAIYAAAIAIAVLVAVLCLTALHLPTAVAVIAAGLAVLGGPFLVQSMPRRLRESQFSPIAILGLSCAALIALPNPF